MLRREEFEAALAGRPVATRRYFSVFVRANDQGRPRLGVIVGRKAAPRAVDRNRIKRLTREAFRHQQEWLGGNDLVVLARRCPPRAGWEALGRELVTLFAQLAGQSTKDLG